MNIMIIIPGLKKHLPYAETYEDVFTKKGYNVNIIEWDRRNLNKINNPYIFTKYSPYTCNPYIRLIHYIQFLLFCKKIICKNSSQLIILCTIATSLFISPLLIWKKISYFIDIRDYSPLVKRCNKLLSYCLSNSLLNIISSEGFKSWLPFKPQYNILNNISKTGPSLNPQRIIKSNEINILTIGYLRNYKANKQLIEMFSNKESYNLHFVGEGPSESILKEYTKENNINNVSFYGYYLKEEEDRFYQQTTFTNIYMEDDVASNTLMSNRIYKSIQNYRPMIAHKHSIQSHFISKYNLGISISQYDDIEQAISSFLISYNSSEFASNCDKCLSYFKQQNQLTYNKIFNTINNIK